jgi:UDP-glucose 4-epimerase
MKIFLTGAGGFIGRNIKEQLGVKHDIVSVPHEEVDLYNFEAVREVLKGEKFDAVVHAARAPVGEDNGAMADLLMYAAVSKAAAECGVKKMISYGSGCEFGDDRELTDAAEERFGQFIPRRYPHFSKYLMNFIKEAGLKQHNLRCFGLFGKYEDYGVSFVSNAICRALCDYSIILKQDRVISYLYIDDLVEITDVFLKNDFCRFDYNITSSEKWSLLDIARLVRKISLKDVPINVALPDKQGEYSGSNKRFLSEFFYAFTPMIDAISMLLDWYILNFDMVKREKLLCPTAL